MKNINYFIKRATLKILKHTEWYDQYWGGVTKFWLSFQFDIDCVNLGSNSGLHGFNYHIEGIKGANWAIGPQSLVHDFNILKNYFCYIKEGGTVFIPICPFSCLISNYSKQSNLKYYTFLHPATIINFEEDERIKALLIKDNPFKAMPMYCIKRTIKEVMKKLIPHRHHEVNFEQSANNLLKLWKQQFAISDLKASLSAQHKKEQEHRASVLHEMIVFCKERSLNPVIVLVPMHKTLSLHLTDKFRQNYIFDFLDQAKIGDTKFIDGFDYYIPDDGFKTSYLLNGKGAKLFTRQVLKDLGLIK